MHPLFQNMWHLGPLVGPCPSENEELFDQPISDAFGYEQVLIVILCKGFCHYIRAFDINLVVL